MVTQKAWSQDKNGQSIVFGLIYLILLAKRNVSIYCNHLLHTEAHQKAAIQIQAREFY
jgi:hypothetical protein